MKTITYIAYEVIEVVAKVVFACVVAFLLVVGLVFIKWSLGIL